MAATPRKQAAESVTVASDDAGRRIDNFLGSRLKDVPRARLYRMLRQGEVRVNGSRIRQDYRLQAGDRIRIPPHWRNAADRDAPEVPPTVAAQVRAAVLYEDTDLLILNKPSGLAVHGGSGLRYGLIDVLRGLRPDEERLELVHRLDRDTSGCLLIARNMPTLQQLHRLLREGGVRKHYLALLRGRLGQRLLEIGQPLRKGRLQSGERMVAVDETGKAATTRLHRRRCYRDATLVQAELLTGRTHQIRVHAAASGHPVAGDRKYGDPAFNKAMRRHGLRRLFLHAESVEIPELRLKVAAPLPDDLETVLEQLAQEDVDSRHASP